MFSEIKGIRTLLGTLVALISYILQTLGALFWVFIIAVFLDIITGVLAGWKNGELDSDFGRKGIAKKVCTFVIIIMALLLDYTAQEYGIPTKGAIYIGTTSAYLAIEATSIMENAVRADVPIPMVFKKALKIFKNNN